MSKRITVKCLQCGKEFETYPSYLRKGRGKFCSISCGTTYKNIHDNPTRDPKVREKISKNHADVSGENNSMFGRRGPLAPSYIDGRSNFPGEIYTKLMKVNGIEERCVICGETQRLHVHHKDGNHENNSIENLEYLCVKCHNTKAHEYIRDENGRFIGSRLILR